MSSASAPVSPLATAAAPATAVVAAPAPAPAAAPAAAAAEPPATEESPGLADASSEAEAGSRTESLVDGVEKSPSDEVSVFKVEGVDADAAAPAPAQKALQKLIPQLRKTADDLWAQKGQSAKDAAELALFPTKALDQLTSAAVKDIFASAGKDFEEAGEAFEAVRQSWTTPFIDAAQLKRLLGESVQELQARESVSDQVASGQRYSPAELQAVLYDLLDTKTAKEAFTKAIDADKDVQGKLAALRAKDGNTPDNKKALAESLVKLFDSKILTEKFGYKLSAEQKTALESVLVDETIGEAKTNLLDYFITPPSNAPVKVAQKRAFATLAIGCSTFIALSATASFLGIAMLSGVGSVIALGAMIAVAVIAYKAYRTIKLEKLARKNAVFSSLRNQISAKFVKQEIQRTTKAATMANKIRTAFDVTKAAAKGLRHGAVGTAKGAAGVGVGAVGLAATAATLAASLPVAGGAAAGVATAHGAKRAAASAKDALEARSDRKLVKSTEKVIEQLEAAKTDLEKRVDAIEKIDTTKRTVKQKGNLANLKEKLQIVERRFAAVNPHAGDERLRLGSPMLSVTSSGVATVSSAERVAPSTTPSSLPRAESAASLAGSGVSSGGGRGGSR